MLKDVGAALLKDSIGIMKHEKQFFSLGTKDRALLIKKYYGQEYPHAFVDYLSNLSEDAFVEEASASIVAIDGGSHNTDSNSFLDAVADYLSGEFAKKFDELDLDFFFKRLPEREEVLEELFPGDSALHQVLADQIIRGTYQELSSLAYKSLSTLKSVPTVLVQSATELPKSMRAAIREHFKKSHPYAFVEFQVNPQILGGIRLFVGGRLTDHSWLASIQSILIH